MTAIASFRNFYIHDVEVPSRVLKQSRSHPWLKTELEVSLETCRKRSMASLQRPIGVALTPYLIGYHHVSNGQLTFVKPFLCEMHVVFMPFDRTPVFRRDSTIRTFPLAFSNEHRGVQARTTNPFP